MQPTILMTAPVMKPVRRPTLPIQIDIGIAASADPSTYVVAPNVASALDCASENPMRPFIEISPAAFASSSAWQHASKKMLRREVSFVMSGAANRERNDRFTRHSTVHRLRGGAQAKRDRKSTRLNSS